MGGADDGIGGPDMGGRGVASGHAVCWAGAGACMYWICAHERQAHEQARTQRAIY